MRQLWSGTDPNDSLLRELFLQKLTSNVRMVLAPADSTTSLDKLAEMADRVMEVSTPTVAALNTPSALSLLKELESLRMEVHQPQDRMRSLSRPSRDSRRRSPTPAGLPPRRSPSPSRQPDHSICWYHQRFGDAATKCRPPCNIGLNDQARH